MIRLNLEEGGTLDLDFDAGQLVLTTQQKGCGWSVVRLNADESSAVRVFLQNHLEP